MRKNNFWVRLLTSVLMIVSFGMLLTTPANLRVGNFCGLVKHVLAQQIKQQGSEDLNDAWAFLKQTGATDQMLTGLPRQVHYAASYATIYELSANKETIEKQVVSEATQPFKQVPLLAKYARRYAKRALRSEEVLELNSYLERYKNYFIAVLLVLVLTILLVLFGHSLGLWLGLVMALGLYGLEATLVQQLATSLQRQVYPGIEMTMGANSTLALIVMIAAALVWQVGRHFSKRKGQR